MKITSGIHAIVGATMYELQVGRLVLSVLRPHMVVGTLRNNGLLRGLRRLTLFRAGIDRYGNWRLG